MIVRTTRFVTLLFAFAGVIPAAQAGDTARFPGTSTFHSPDGKMIVRDVVEAEDERGVRHALLLEDAATKQEKNRISYMGTAEVRWSSDSRRILATFYNENHEGYIAIVGAGTRDGQTPFAPELMAGLLPAHERRFNDNEFVSIEGQAWKGSDEALFSVRGRGHHDPRGFRMSCSWRISTQEMNCQLLRSQK